MKKKRSFADRLGRLAKPDFASESFAPDVESAQVQRGSVARLDEPGERIVTALRDAHRAATLFELRVRTQLAEQDIERSVKQLAATGRVSVTKTGDGDTVVMLKDRTA